MNPSIVSALFPVVLLIAVGYLAARMRWIAASSVRDLSNVVFYLLVPPLLFRTMGKVHVEHLDFSPVLAYFAAVILIFGGTLLLLGFNRRAAVLALANTFSNTVMIGIPLVSLAYGQEGLVTLFTLYTVHTVVLLTFATVVLELAVMREQVELGHQPGRNKLQTVLLAMRNAVLHPVPLPLIAALLFAQTGLQIPAIIDAPLKLLGDAFGPLALVLVGVTLGFTSIHGHWRGALALAVVKNLLHPALVAAAGLVIGLRGLPLAVMVVTSSLPIGANVFLFSQRYKVGQDLVTTAMVMSTGLALVTVPMVMWAAGFL